MPRQARLDAPGTLHHVIVRGIEKRPIVLRAGIIGSIFKMARYRWCGHSVISGKLKNDWQEKEFRPVVSWVFPYQLLPRH